MAETFLNPYNFISLPDKKAYAYDDADKHTGVIEYSITTHSPLFIPNTSSENAFNKNGDEHKTFDFYSYNELNKNEDYSNRYFEPVIPGSELRGMVRGIYETLTDSCMGVLNQSKHPVMRVGEAYKAGLIKKESTGGYSLYKAKDIVYSIRDGKSAFVTKEKEGSKVFFGKPMPPAKHGAKEKVFEIKSMRDNAHNNEGFLIKGQAGPRKKHCHIFAPDVAIRKMTEKDLDGLKEVLDSYQEQPNASKSYVEYQTEFKKFRKNEGNEFFPVYYSSEGNYWYLAPACFTRERSKHSLGELAGEFEPCSKAEKKCPSCDLFGMTGNDNNEAGVSKIRFADAKVEKRENNREYYAPIVTLESLGQPRLNNIEFYLKRPDRATFWNYDYMVVGDTVKIYKAELRGRKFYWHQNKKVLRTDIAKTNLNKTIRPVKCGITFRGKLFFEGISQKQLNQLLWILNGESNVEQPEKGPLAYKIGMGKPLGLGSVTLKVDNYSERILDVVDEKVVYAVRQNSVEDLYYEEVGFSDYVKTDFFTISALNAAEGKLVTYPIIKGQENKPMERGYEWFVQNHGGGMPTKRIALKRIYVLPMIKGEKQLPVLVKADNNNNGRYGSGNNKPYNNKNSYGGNKNFKKKR